MMAIKRQTLLGTFVAAAATVACLATGPAQGATVDNPAKGGSSILTATRPAAGDHAAKAPTVPSTSAALTAIQSKIARYVSSHGTRYSFASYVDPATGRIVLSTNAPTSVITAVTRVKTTSAAQERAAKQIRIQTTTVSDSFNRRDDTPSFWAAAGLSDGAALCSSGEPVRNSAGTVFMTTAGHCYANGTSVSTESRARVYGTVSNRHLPTVTGDAKDMELLGGQSYAGRVYIGDQNSSTSKPIYGAGDPVVGFTNYCHSGRTTGEQCGHTAISTTAQVCTQTGCKSPVIAFRGGNLSQGGDSGGSFYVYSVDGKGVHIRGHVLAGDGTTSYAELWSVVASTLGVSIVTG